MDFRICRGVVAAIRAHAAAALPDEACGLLLGQGREVRTALPSPNVSLTPRTAFEIDPALLVATHRAARDGGPAIIGVYHSHPGGSAVPSATDAARITAAGQLWIIVAGANLSAQVSRIDGSGGCFEAAALTMFDGD